MATSLTKKLVNHCNSMTKASVTRLEFLADKVLQFAKQIKQETTKANLLDKKCVCGQCGETVICKHGKSEAHVESICGGCV